MQRQHINTGNVALRCLRQTLFLLLSEVSFVAIGCIEQSKLPSPLCFHFFFPAELEIVWVKSKLLPLRVVLGKAHLLLVFANFLNNANSKNVFFVEILFVSFFLEVGIHDLAFDRTALGRLSEVGSFHIWLQKSE